MASGESRDEDVDLAIVHVFFVVRGVHDFEAFRAANTQVEDGGDGVAEDVVQGGGVANEGGFGFARVFPKLAPKGVEHQFGTRLPSGVFDDESGIEGDPFVGEIIGHIAVLCFGGVGPGRIAARFGFDLEPRVHVVGKEPLLLLVGWKVPDFVNGLNGVALGHGFIQFGGAPGAGESALVGGVRAVVTSFEEGFGHFVTNTGAAEGKRQFTSVTKGQDGVVKTVGWENGDFGETEEGGDVGVGEARDDFGVFDGVGGVFVNPRVEGRDVLILDGFPFGHVVVKFDGIGTSTEKRVARVEGGDEVLSGEKEIDGGIALVFPLPIAFPFGHHVVPSGTEGGYFGLGAVVAVLKGFFLPYACSGKAFGGVAARTPVEVTPVKFVDGAGGGVEPVYQATE